MRQALALVVCVAACGWGSWHLGFHRFGLRPEDATLRGSISVIRDSEVHATRQRGIEEFDRRLAEGVGVLATPTGFRYLDQGCTAFLALLAESFVTWCAADDVGRMREVMRSR